MSTVTVSETKVIVDSHVESKDGAAVRVQRLELSKAGTALLTSKSQSIQGAKLAANASPGTAQALVHRKRA